jgi:hypothetical protein
MPNLWSAEKYYFTIVVCRNDHASYSYFAENIFAESQFLTNNVSECKRHGRAIYVHNDSKQREQVFSEFPSSAARKTSHRPEIAFVPVFTELSHD